MERLTVNTSPEDWSVFNHGKTWTVDMHTTLVQLYVQERKSVDFIAKCLGRQRSSIVSRLVHLGLVKQESEGTFSYTYKYYQLTNEQEYKRVLTLINTSVINDYTTNKPKPKLKETPKVATKTIETKVFIAGVDAAEMSDDQIFSKIAQVECEIEKLSKINNKPKKLATKLLEMHEDIKKLVEYVDGR